jgi:hypothetical protein
LLSFSTADITRELEFQRGFSEEGMRAHIPRQEVTLLYTLYRIPFSLAMLSRKEVLNMCIDASFEIRYVREPGKAQVIKRALKFLIHH